MNIRKLAEIQQAGHEIYTELRWIYDRYKHWNDAKELPRCEHAIKRWKTAFANLAEDKKHG